jgi:tRNA pseudouridine(38-40) synthase
MPGVRSDFVTFMGIQLASINIQQTYYQLSFQVAHFVTPFNYDSLESIHAALNGLLPADIRVRELSAAVPEFHARFSAESKLYHYKIYNDTIIDPFQRRYAYHSAYKLNTAVMREAASYFIGKHDFSAFVNASHNDRVPDPVKIISRFDVIEMVIVRPQNKFSMWYWMNEICFTSESQIIHSSNYFTLLF